MNREKGFTNKNLQKGILQMLPKLEQSKENKKFKIILIKELKRSKKFR
jgi:hypothetical protein